MDIDSISINDVATYKLYSEGKTVGTFQFESAGMQKYLRELQPTTFEDLIAMNALYRPGPMDYIPQFIDRKHGREPIEYDIPVMEKYLKVYIWYYCISGTGDVIITFISRILPEENQTLSVKLWEKN